MRARANCTERPQLGAGDTVGDSSGDTGDLGDTGVVGTAESAAESARSKSERRRAQLPMLEGRVQISASKHTMQLQQL